MLGKKGPGRGGSARLAVQRLACHPSEFVRMAVQKGDIACKILVVAQAPLKYVLRWLQVMLCLPCILVHVSRPSLNAFCMPRVYIVHCGGMSP